MKNFIGLIVFILAGMLTGCDKQDVKRPDDCISVTYVRGICGQAVLKIQSPADYHYGEDADGDENVFLATLECFTDAEPLQDKVFYVQLNPADFNSNCAVCMAAVMYSGSKHYKVRVQTNCETGLE